MDVTHVISVFVVLGFAWSAAFFRLSAIVWTVLIGVVLLFLTIFSYLPPIAAIIFWLLFIPAVAFVHLSAWRRRYIISPALKHLQKQMPTVSVTERAAIEAGDTWWEKELFCGRPDWKKLFNIPRPTLTQEEQQFLDNQVEHLCSLINDWEFVDKEKDLSPELWNYLKSEKFFGMAIPKEYGGLGFSALAHSTVVTKIATRSISTAVTTMVPNSLGPGELVMHYGTEEQKNHYLPRLAIGAEIPCFALTGPDAGSDAGAISDTGIICRGQYEGKEIIGIRLSWDKRYITLAPVATVLGIAFHLYDPDGLLVGKEDIGITLALIPTSHPGVEIGNRHIPMYLAFMNGPTRGKDVFIPMDWIIGGSKMAGQGWQMLMECLSIGRSISLPALSTACGKISYRLTGAYARVRRQFNTPISSFEGIEEALGYIAGYAYTLEATRMMTAGAIDQKITPSIASAISKYHMTEMARYVVSHSMDIHSGQMIQVGPRNLFANIYLAVPISITVEGANILTRNLIIFGQGAIRCHPYILKEIEIISSKDPDVKALDKTLMAHMGFYISNFCRNLTYGLTGGHLIYISSNNKLMKKYKPQLARMSAALALLADTSLITLGGSLKRRERISARLGDIMSQLYLASAVLKYYHDHNKPDSDINNVRWAIENCLHKIQIACDDLFENFPNKWLGALLRMVIFPWGRAYQPPKDSLHKDIVSIMLSPSALRDRITQHCYISKNETDLGFRLDKAIIEVASTDAIWKKLHKAVQSGAIPARFDFNDRVNLAVKNGILTMEEAGILREYENLRTEIIKVNEFSFNLDTMIA